MDPPCEYEPLSNAVTGFQNVISALDDVTTFSDLSRGLTQAGAKLSAHVHSVSMCLFLDISSLVIYLYRGLLAYLAHDACRRLGHQ